MQKLTRLGCLWKGHIMINTLTVSDLRSDLRPALLVGHRGGPLTIDVLVLHGRCFLACHCRSSALHCTMLCNTWTHGPGWTETFGADVCYGFEARMHHACTSVSSNRKPICPIERQTGEYEHFTSPTETKHPFMSPMGRETSRIDSGGGGGGGKCYLYLINVKQ
jgi:hypothetical protein